MLVYITQSEKTALFRDTCHGLPLLHLTVGQGRIAKWQAGRHLKKLDELHIRRGIFEEELWPLAAKYHIWPVEVLPLRLAVVEQLLPLVWSGEGDTALLRCGWGGEDAARRCVGALTRLARYVRLDKDDPAHLRQVLMRRWGVAEGGGEPSLTVCTGTLHEDFAGAALYLTPDCHRRQAVLYRWEKAGETVPEPLLAALYGAGNAKAEEIRVVSVYPCLTGGEKTTIMTR